MKTLRGFTELDLGIDASVVSIGNFDGVHLGHQVVIGSSVAAAARRDVPSVVCTFDPHTALVLRPDSPPRLLETLEQRLAAIEALGVDVAVVIPFDLEVAATPREEFVERFLRGTLRAQELHVSKAFTFGARGEGNVDYLREVGDAHGIELVVVDSVLCAGGPVSSTRIRDALAGGRVADAAEQLGRPFSIVGEVVTGAGRGRHLDAPTANLEVENSFVPGRGVYITEARVDGTGYPAITNVGVRPTFESDGALTVETHLLDTDLSLVGKRMELAFLERLRDEIRFESAEALAQQIAEDARQAALYVATEYQALRYTAEVSSQVQPGEPPEDKR